MRHNAYLIGQGLPIDQYKLQIASQISPVHACAGAVTAGAPVISAAQAVTRNNLRILIHPPFGA